MTTASGPGGSRGRRHRSVGLGAGGQTARHLRGVGDVITWFRLGSALLIIVALWVGIVLAWSAGWGSAPVRVVLAALAVVGTLNSLAYVHRHCRALGAERSVLVIDDPPVCLGGRLRGHIEIDLGPEPLGEVSLTLLSERLVKVYWRRQLGTSFPRMVPGSPSVKLEWEAQRRLAGTSLERLAAARWRVPVDFDLPSDGKASGADRPDETINWALRLAVAEGGDWALKDAWEVRVVEA